jgi:hypothetical protein
LDLRPELRAVHWFHLRRTFKTKAQVNRRPTWLRGKSSQTLVQARVPAQLSLRVGQVELEVPMPQGHEAPKRPLEMAERCSKPFPNPESARAANRPLTCRQSVSERRRDRLRGTPAKIPCKRWYRTSARGLRTAAADRRCPHTSGRSARTLSSKLAPPASTEALHLGLGVADARRGSQLPAVEQR